MYGGPCPKCFAEIPGEEAPTDPGAEARAIQERKDRRGATIRAFVGLAAMAAVAIGLLVLGRPLLLWWVGCGPTRDPPPGRLRSRVGPALPHPAARHRSQRAFLARRRPG